MSLEQIKIIISCLITSEMSYIRFNLLRQTFVETQVFHSRNRERAKSQQRGRKLILMVKGITLYRQIVLTVQIEVRAISIRVREWLIVMVEAYRMRRDRFTDYGRIRASHKQAALETTSCIKKDGEFGSVLI